MSHQYQQQYNFVRHGMARRLLLLGVIPAARGLAVGAVAWVEETVVGDTEVEGAVAVRAGVVVVRAGVVAVRADVVVWDKECP